MNRLTGYTLLELLIVIATIIVLTAVVFPVFAQARGRVSGDSCASNVKQLTNAVLQYAQDYDESVPTQKFAANGLVEMQTLLKPYIGSQQSFYCPSRTLVHDDCKSADNPTGRCFGYGMNFGIYTLNSGSGVFYPKADVPGTGSTVWRGHNLSDFSHPASTLLLGDTMDAPMYTLTLNAQMEECLATHQCSAASLRHRGSFMFSFMDGHSKSICMAPYSLESEGDSYDVMPVKPADLRLYCRDTEAVQSTSGYGSGLTCGQVAFAIARDRTALP